jgi:hypothetical protein
LWQICAHNTYAVPESGLGPTIKLIPVSQFALRGERPGEAGIMNDVLLFLVVAMLFNGIMLAAASVLAH